MIEWMDRPPYQREMDPVSHNHQGMLLVGSFHSLLCELVFPEIACLIVFIKWLPTLLSIRTSIIWTDLIVNGLLLLC